MNKFFGAIKNAPKRTSAVIAMALGVVMIPAALFAYGPERPTYTIENPADHVTFNSITNNPTYGDEREFVTVSDVTTGSAFSGKATLTPGHTYKVQMYVHNDAATKYNDAAHNYAGIARDTTIRAYLPQTVNGSDTVDGYVSASNSAPKTVYDTAALTANGQVNIEYVQDSAMLHTWKQQTKLPNLLFSSNGTRIGSGDVAGTDLSGNWNGCIDYAATVTYEFKVAQPAKPDFTVAKTVSAHGANKYGETVAAKPGDLVDFRIRYQNTGDIQQDNVMVIDSLPAGLNYVAGTSTLITSKTPDGAKISDNVTGKGVNIGSYAPTGAGYVNFTAKVSENDKLPVCGVNTLTNTATVETDNGKKSDTATVTVSKECQPAPEKVKVCDTTTKQIVTVTKAEAKDDKYTTDMTACEETPVTPETPPVTPETPATPEAPAELPHTGAGSVIASVIGAGSLIAAAYYYIASRRMFHN